LYTSVADGGRTRPDGVVLKWRIIFPEREHGRGAIPFFCEDVAPRDLRVPSDPPENTAHPSSAKGIAYIKVLSPTERYATLVHHLSAIVGSKPLSSSPSDTTWILSTLSGDPQHFPRLIVSAGIESTGVVAPEGEITEVGFWVDKGRDGPVEDGPPGRRVVWVESP